MPTRSDRRVSGEQTDPVSIDNRAAPTIRPPHIVMTDPIRTFVACELPREIRSAIGQIQQNLKQSRLRLKWVRPENLHLTLAFLGEVEAERIEAISGVVRTAARGYAPLLICAKGIGVFPGMRRPRVLWVGIGGQRQELTQLQAAVAGGLAAVGFPREKRPFKGHLTIGRVKAAVDTRRLGEALATYADFESAGFTIDQVVVFRSQLRPDGPVYTRLSTATLNPH